MKRSKLVINERLNCSKCNDCGNIIFPSRDYCNKCQSLNTSQEQLGPEGKLMSYTISYIRPLMGNLKIPYPYGVARFWNQDGQAIDVLGLIDSIEPFDEVEIDKKVRLTKNRTYVSFKVEGY